jgi:serine/threonine-protein kinase
MRANWAEPDTVLGERYRLERLIASGGMAQVWLARDRVLDRPVAIKILHGRFAADPGVAARFRREAIAAARINHPGIVAIFDTWTAPPTLTGPGAGDNTGNGDGTADAPARTEAIVMEYVDGHDLRHELASEGPLPIGEVLAIGIAVADALHAAHEAGVIHRDIKPANILLDTGSSAALGPPTPGAAGPPAPDAAGVDAQPQVRRILVTDFGIAKAFAASGTAARTGPGGQAGPRTQAGPITQAGIVLGTARYLAPEQVAGGEVDARADIYALGAVLYEALAGRPAFRGDGDLAVAMARLHRDPVPLRQLRADVPRDLEAVVHRALARDPEARFATAQDLWAALLAAARTSPPAGEPPPLHQPSVQQVEAFVRSERRWLVPAGFVVAVALAVSAGGLTVGREATGDLLDRARGLPSPATTLTTAPVASEEGAFRLASRPSAFDPAGDDKTEHPDKVGNLVDADPATYWQTQTYLDNLPRTKPGVGFVLALEEATELSSLQIQARQTGWKAEVYLTEAAPPATLAGWGSPVTTVAGDEPAETVALEGRRAGAVLVWLVALPGQPDGYRAEISGAELWGRR